MKKLVSLLLAAGTLFLTSCQDNGPENPTDYQQRYTGTWDVTEETGINAPQSYSVNITEGSNENEIVIEGLYNIGGTEVLASIDRLDISIPQQETDGISFSGSGQANADFDQISLNFVANNGTGNDSVEAVLIKN